MQLLQVLKNRLLMEQLLKDHPEIRDIELLPPVVIAGLPRTGTTHLHNLLAAGPTFRVLRYWESIEPFPMPRRGRAVTPDPRLARTDMAVDFMNQAMPHFKLMHEMTTEHVHEEIQLLFNDLSSMLMETLGHVPAWRDHYLAHDQTPHYEHMRTPAPVPPAPARRTALAAQVAAAPRAAAGAREGVPRPDRRHHPPRPACR